MMCALTGWIPALPLLGFLILALWGGRSERGAAAVGIGTVAASAVLALGIGARYLLAPPDDGLHTQVIWHWMQVGDYSADVALQLDALSLVMTVVITVTGALIMAYSRGFMTGEEGYARFFAYMNLFVGCMLILVLARDLVLLYLGWEGVGLCSYLLIGFWYKNPDNGRAARKAFIVTRIGDAAMAVGLLMLFTQLGTLEIPTLLSRAQSSWAVGSHAATVVAWLLLVGAVAKSAQLPFQVWLPDAMAGPSPVSALIHAATMVTAGVYLIARLHVVFALAPVVQGAIAVIGAATLLVAGVSATTQWDIKRVLAYSTISQLGYMFLALGVGAWSAAVYHFMTHAFFKSLLFLCAGVIIHAMNEDHDLYNMRGLRKALPVTFIALLFGALSLSGLPPTGGFSSKDLILARVYEIHPHAGLYAAGLAGVFLTGLYTFRMFFLAFGDSAQVKVSRRPTVMMRTALGILAVLCIGVAFLAWPEVFGGRAWLPDFLHRVFVDRESSLGTGTARWLSTASVLVALGGAAAGWFVAMRGREAVKRLSSTSLGAAIHGWWLKGWGFDWLYDRLIVRPVVWLARINRNDVIDDVLGLFSYAALAGHRAIRRTQTGRVGWYVTCMAAGLVIILAVVLWT